MTTVVPAGSLLTFAVGGGWGDEEASAETTPCLVVRGTDLMSVRVGSLDGVPLRYETPKKLASRALQEGRLSSWRYRAARRDSQLGEPRSLLSNF